jgi:hypothetical protein
VIVNPAIHHMASAQMQADALRDSLRNPRLPDEPKPSDEPKRRRVALLRRLRPVLS